jgi:zinc transporter ZupT
MHLLARSHRFQSARTLQAFVVVIGFGAAALLYLALVDLIPAVHEMADAAGLAPVWITVSMFGGFTIVIALENLSPDKVV